MDNLNFFSNNSNNKILPTNSRNVNNKNKSIPFICNNANNLIKMTKKEVLLGKRVRLWK